MFNERDLQLISNKDLSIEDIESQLDIFKKGIDFVEVLRPATTGDGIEKITEEEISRYTRYYDEQIPLLNPAKFVPASGAATRMFKSLFDLYHTLHEKSDVKTDDTQEQFFNQLEEYPFYRDLARVMEKKGMDIEKVKQEKDYQTILDFILTSRGLNYGSLPKGLLAFHSYPQEVRTAFEEHFKEAVRLFGEKSDEIYMHFTVSSEHLDLFSHLRDLLIKKYREQEGLEFRVTFSFQSPSTDTIAVTPDNRPFRKEDGSLLFRPGGHGALLENLASVQRKILFIGNIDNISPDSNAALRVRYKKLLGGYLLEKVNFIHSALEKLDKGDRSSSLRESLVAFIREISPKSAESLKKASNDRFNELAFDFLNRPVRVCGMVKNVGEPGGGPFWIKSSEGRISKQIIESSQIDLDNPDQKKIFRASTHFNPVDIVACTKSFNNAPFDLLKFRDPSMAFISRKSQGGKELKALELPGLWNGSMAGWLTWFVEVPVETFTPVKTIFDLNRPEHKGL